MKHLKSCLNIPPWLSPRGYRIWAAFLLTLLLSQGVALVIEMGHTFPYHTVDFAQHYFLGLWVNSGGSVTDPQWPHLVHIAWPQWAYTVIPFLPYQAFLLPLMRLLARLPYTWAVLLWEGVALSLWVRVALGLARGLDLPRPCVLLFVALSPPLWQGFYWGNVDIYLGAALIGALLAWHHRQAFLSGWLWGWISAIKPPFFLGAIPILRRKPLPSLAGLLSGWATSLAIAWWAVGASGIHFFATHLKAYSQETLRLLMPFNASVQGLVAALFAPRISIPLQANGTVHTFQGMLADHRGLLTSLPWAFAFLMLLATWYAARQLDDVWLATGLWMSLALVLGPLGWPHYNLYLIAPWLYLTRILPDQHRWVGKLWFLLFPTLLIGGLWEAIARLAPPIMLLPLTLGTLRILIWGLFLGMALTMSSKREVQ